MAGDSWSRGREFESQYRILSGSFLHLFAVKIVLMFENTENTSKEVGTGPFKRYVTKMKLN